jgi:penicillin-binding protein 2
MSTKSLTEHKIAERHRNRIWAFAMVVITFISLFIFQLFKLQIINGNENSLKAERFVRKSESVPATRGQIYDRNFVTPEVSTPLVSNSSSLDVILNTNQLKNDPKRIKEFVFEFCKFLGIPFEYYYNDLQEPKFSKKIKSREPFVLLEGISKEQQERISVFDSINKNVIMIASPTRNYNMGPALAHVTGYVGKPTTKDIQDRDIKTYQLVGKGGIEAQYDKELRGMDGFRIQKRNSDGEIEEERVIEHAVSGNNIILTIDKDIQIAAYRALKGVRGTLIALKPSTGEIIAMASNPSYDPNLLSGKNKTEKANHFKRVTKNGGFLNLAIQSKFPPASTFKTLVAIAGLESEHRIHYDPSQEYNCKGSFTLKSTYAGVPDQEFKCWEPKGHGTNNLAHALEKSCSVYFYHLGYKLGAEPILSYSRLFGLDKKSGIDLPGELNGFIPSSEWKKRSYGTKWFDGDTINLSIGQGFITSTPMEIALFYMGIVNYGKIYQPHLLKEIRNPIDNSTVLKVDPVVIRDVPLKRSTIDSVREGLFLVGYSGTASGVLNQPNLPEIAGKTGTAQTRRRGVSASNHAWFVGFAPYNAPPDQQLLVLTFVEYGMGGSMRAAPVAREVFKAAYPPGSFTRTERFNRAKYMKEEMPIQEEF